MQKLCLFTDDEMTFFHEFFCLFDISTVNSNINTWFLLSGLSNLNTKMANYTIATLFCLIYSQVMYILQFYKKRKKILW